MYYSGRCPPSLEWRLLVNEADINPKVLRSRKIVHNDISVSVILDEPIEELEPSRPVCSIVIHPEDRTSDLKIQDCSEHWNSKYFHVYPPICDKRFDSGQIGLIGVAITKPLFISIR